MGEELTDETAERDLVERYRRAYEERDIEHLTALFADDAELTRAGGTFRGQEALRRLPQWDAPAVQSAQLSVLRRSSPVIAQLLPSSSARMRVVASSGVMTRSRAAASVTST